MTIDLSKLYVILAISPDEVGGLVSFDESDDLTTNSLAEARNKAQELKGFYPEATYTVYKLEKVETV